MSPGRVPGRRTQPPRRRGGIGEKVFESFGGLDVAHEVLVKGNRWRFALRPDLLEDRELLQEGIETRFDPLLPGAGSEP